MYKKPKTRAQRAKDRQIDDLQLFFVSFRRRAAAQKTLL